MTREERMDVSRCVNDMQRDHLKFIDEEGVSILSVAPRLAEDGAIWSYTIGLWQQYQHPEVLITGLFPVPAVRILDDINRRIRDDGERFDVGCTSSNLLEGYLCTFQEIDTSSYGDWLLGVEWFYGSTEFKTVQMLWPDLDHTYPWEPNATVELRHDQPIISSRPGGAVRL